MLKSSNIYRVGSVGLFIGWFCLSLASFAEDQVTPPSSAETPNQQSLLIGQWDYTAFFYQGHRYEKPNPQLHVTFDFETETEVRLTWLRDEDGSLCERLASYEIRNNDTLYQKNIWVNPDNSFECGKDPDMILGHESETKFKIEQNELNLYLGLNGEDFIYILARVNLSH